LDGAAGFLQNLAHDRISSNSFLYWEFHERGFQQALRMGDWKVVRPQADAPLELYNLKMDLGERQNIAKDHSDVVATLENYLTTARTESNWWPIKKQSAPKTNQSEAPAKDR